jgi:hypothetical protein
MFTSVGWPGPGKLPPGSPLMLGGAAAWQTGVPSRVVAGPRSVTYLRSPGMMLR